MGKQAVTTQNGKARGKASAKAAEVAEVDDGDLKAVKTPNRRASAETMASRQREISVSEFFTKNRHLLGFDNPHKALLTTVKEAVDLGVPAPVISAGAVQPLRKPGQR